MADYRFDSRSKDQFAADISKCTQEERLLMTLYAAWSEKQTGRKTAFANLGVDNSGDFIEDIKKIGKEADFLLVQMDRPNRKIEIKFSRKSNNRFHIKEGQLKFYAENDTWLIVFNGIETDDMTFCVLSPKMMQEALITGYKCLFWSKKCIRFLNSQLKWYHINETLEKNS